MDPSKPWLIVEVVHPELRPTRFARRAPQVDIDGMKLNIIASELAFGQPEPCFLDGRTRSSVRDLMAKACRKRQQNSKTANMN
jgi:hypothetical protein